MKQHLKRTGAGCYIVRRNEPLIAAMRRIKKVEAAEAEANAVRVLE